MNSKIEFNDDKIKKQSKILISIFVDAFEMKNFNFVLIRCTFFSSLNDKSFMLND